MIRLGVFTTHPIQYYVPLWRYLSKYRDLDVTVHYFSDISVRGGLDKDFNRPVKWDIPLLDGYKSTFISRDADLEKPWSIRMPDTQSFLRKSNYDCVLLLSYSRYFDYQVIREASKLGIEVAMRAEFSDIGKRNPVKAFIRDFYLKWLYRKIDAFAVIGENARRHLLKRGVPEKKMVWSPYTVDTDLFEEQKKKFKRDKCRKELGFSKKDFVVLFSGKFIPRKEPFLLLKAMSRLSKYKNLKLVMLGEGPLKKEAMNIAKKILPGKVLFPGFANQSELGRYYVASDLFVLPSNHETWGLVVNEAMQFGLPVIVSDQVGCRYDLVKAESTGTIFPSGNVEVLAEQILKIFLNKDESKKWRKGIEVLMKRYTVFYSADGIYKALKLKNRVTG